jgi:hypothetical protein
MPNKLCLPPKVRLMPRHIQRKYASGEFDRTGMYAGSRVAKVIGGHIVFCCD